MDESAPYTLSVRPSVRRPTLPKLRKPGGASLRRLEARPEDNACLPPTADCENHALHILEVTVMVNAHVRETGMDDDGAMEAEKRTTTQASVDTWYSTHGRPLAEGTRSVKSKLRAMRLETA